MTIAIEYKVKPSQKKWDTMHIPFEYFNSDWDDEQISSEIMEYVYTDIRLDDDEDYEENCSVTDMTRYVQIVQSHFGKQNQLNDDHKKEFELMSF